MMAEPADIRTRMARSITAGTGALIGGMGVATPIVAAALAELWWGRPSSTSGLAFLMAIFLGAGGTAVGAALGYMVATVVRRSPRAGPVDWPLAGVLLVVVAAVPSVLLVTAVLRQEALNTPRVIVSTGAIVPTAGASSLQPICSATFLWSLPGRTHTAHALRWNGEPVLVSLRDQQLEVSAGSVQGDAVSLADFDYVREISGVTATMTSGRTEFLALLLDLRRSGRRSLLLVFDPRGTLVHQELMHRRSAKPTLVAAGRPGQQEISVNVSWPVRYSAALR